MERGTPSLTMWEVVEGMSAMQPEQVIDTWLSQMSGLESLKNDKRVV